MLFTLLLNYYNIIHFIAEQDVPVTLYSSFRRWSMTSGKNLAQDVIPSDRNKNGHIAASPICLLQPISGHSKSKPIV
jgi:hypothetical protein